MKISGRLIQNNDSKSGKMQQEKINLYEKNKKDTLEFLEIYDDVENIDDLVKLIKKINHLMPINRKDKVEHLIELISYIETLINGDPIAQHIALTYRSELAKESLDEIIKYIQEHTITAYEEKKSNLESDINLLSTKKENLCSELQSLEQKNVEITKDVEVARQELIAINRDLEDKRQSGISKVEKEIGKEKEKLLNENRKLLQTQKELQEIINALKDELAILNTQISSGEQQKEVSWESITVDHPLYNTNCESIKDYIYSLKLSYCKNMGCSMEEAEIAFKTHCSELNSVQSILINYFSNNKNAGSIYRIITYDNWDITHCMKADSLKSMLRTIKLPNFQKISIVSKSLIDQTSIPDNMNTLVRELHFQKVALEALAAKKVAEQNLQIVINILGQFLPNDFDLNKYLIQGNPQISQETLSIEKDLVKKIY